MKSNFTKILMIFWLTLSSIAAVSGDRVKSAPVGDAYNPDRIFSREQLREDLAVIRTSFEEGHGALYRYSTKAEMDGVFDAASAGIDRDMTEREFLRILLPVVAAVNCGHTSVRQSGYFTWLENQPVTFPLGIRYLKRTPYLVRNYSDVPDIPAGGELISINGMSISRILADLLPAIPSDAHIETSKFHYLGSTTRFSQLFNIFYGPTRNYRVEYRDPETGGIEAVEVEGTRQAEVLDMFQKRYPEQAKTSPLLSFREIEGVPVLTIRTFGSSSLGRAGFDYPDFLRKTFQELVDKDAGSLVIDLRENGGGNDDYGKMLFAHLMDEDFQYYAALEVKNNTFEFFKYTNLPKEEWTFPADRVRKNERGWYDTLGHPNLGLQKPGKPVFRGRVYVLINGRSFSATGETTSLMHYHKKAVFIGEECGAGYYGNTSGFMVVVNLPATKIGVTVPLVRYTMAVEGYPEDRGIIPDYPLEPTVADVLAERDAVLYYAVDLAKNKR